MGKPEHTKQFLADALRRLLETKRYADITVADIVRECGVSRYTFYYHFKDKQDLVNWIYLDMRTQAVKVTNVDTLEGNLARLQELFFKDIKLYRQVANDSNSAEFKDYCNQLSYYCFMNLFRSYLGSRQVDPGILDFLARYHAYAGGEICWAALDGKSQLSFEQMNELALITWERGLYGTLDYFAENADKKSGSEI